MPNNSSAPTLFTLASVLSLLARTDRISFNFPLSFTAFTVATFVIEPLTGGSSLAPASVFAIESGVRKLSYAELFLPSVAFCPLFLVNIS